MKVTLTPWSNVDTNKEALRRSEAWNWPMREWELKILTEIILLLLEFKLILFSFVLTLENIMNFIF